MMPMPDRSNPKAPSHGIFATPAVDVRIVLFTLASGGLLVAIRNQTGEPGVPRDVPDAGESLDAAARRIVRASTSIPEQYIEQLYTFSVPEFDEHWSIIVSYLALVCFNGQLHSSNEVTWQSIDQLDTLSDADHMLVDYAVVRLRAKLGYTNIAFDLLPPRFTLTELQNAYETILGQPLDKRNFRRRVIASGILVQTGEQQRDRSNRPASLYRFRAERDATSYLTPPWAEPTNGAIEA